MLKDVRKALTLQLRSGRVYRKDGSFFISIKTPCNANIYTLIHGTLIKALQGKTEVFNRGLATLITARGISITDAVRTAEIEGSLKIQLPSEIERCSSLQHYLLDNDKSIGVTFSLAQENQETKKAAN